MTPPDKGSSDITNASIGSIVGTVGGGIIMLIFVALWTGTLSGPTNPGFWGQAALLAAIIVFVLLLVVRPTRNVLWSSAQWVIGLRLMTQKQRNALATKGQQRPAKRTQGLYGVIMHGRLSCHPNMNNSTLQVKWRSNKAEIGILAPGRQGGWDVVYSATREVLDWVDSKEKGMELLEAKGISED